MTHSDLFKDNYLKVQTEAIEAQAKSAEEQTRFSRGMFLLAKEQHYFTSVLAFTACVLAAIGALTVLLNLELLNFEEAPIFLNSVGIAFLIFFVFLMILAVSCIRKIPSDTKK